MLQKTDFNREMRMAIVAWKVPLKEHCAEFHHKVHCVAFISGNFAL